MPFAIVVVVALGLQSSLARLFGVGPQRVSPDLLLMLTVVLAFRGSRERAPIACWILGLCKDLTTHAPLGAYAVGFGLLGIGLVYLREVLFGENAIVLMILTAIGSFAVEHLTLFVTTFKGDFTWRDYPHLLPTLFFSALFTAGLTPYAHWLATRFQRQFGFPTRRRYGG